MSNENSKGVIELGSVSIKCVIFQINSDNTSAILSASTTNSDGIHNGVIVSPAKASNAIRLCIAEAEKKDYEVIIAAAGGAAHLAGVTAALTTIPVLGVPMPSVTNGVDSLYSTVQMPAGVPVATLAIGKAGAKNSALFAIAILSRKYPKIKDKLKKFRSDFESNIPKRPY